MRFKKPLINFFRALSLGLAIISCVACGIISDPATRLDDRIDSSVASLGHGEGDTLTIRYQPDVDSTGSYRVQFDKVGVLIVWYENAKGKVIDSATTSHIARYVDIPRRFIIEKPAGSELIIKLQRHNGRAIIKDVR